jgi:hypothetical protein
MTEGKAKYISGLLKSEKLVGYRPIEFTKLVYIEEDQYEVHTYIDELSYRIKQYLDAVCILNNIMWLARPSGTKLHIVLYTPSTWAASSAAF